MSTLAVQTSTLFFAVFVGCGFSNPCPSSAGSACVIATIHVSGSTNSAPIDVVVHADGSAERTIGQGSTNVPESPKTFEAGDPDVEQFISDLEAAGDVEHYSYIACGKSAAAGTTTTIVSGGEGSGDVQCISPDASVPQRAVARDCEVLANE